MALKIRGSVFMFVTLIAVFVFPGTEGSCVDKVDNCANYEQSTCSTYKAWSKTNCARRCGYCSGDVCPAGWKRYTGDQTCLKLFTDTESFTWAQSKCDDYTSGNLAIIRDEYKNAFVKAMVPKGKVAWIGVKNPSFKEGVDHLQFVDGSKPGSYHPVMNPNPKWNEDCVEMSRGDYDGYWYYRNCFDSLYFVCQIPARNNG